MQHKFTILCPMYHGVLRNIQHTYQESIKCRISTSDSSEKNVDDNVFVLALLESQGYFISSQRQQIYNSHLLIIVHLAWKSILNVRTSSHKMFIVSSQSNNKMCVNIVQENQPRTHDFGSQWEAKRRSHKLCNVAVISCYRNRRAINN